MKKFNIKTVAFLFLYCLPFVTLDGQPDDLLSFPVDKYTTENKIVKTSTGEKNVTYHYYQNIQYVAKPVDKNYQSLNVSVPVKIDGKNIDATKSPVLFVIGVGGYMSVNINRPAFGGPRGNSSISSNADLALAAGYVVVAPACRGRDNKAADGTFYGKAPAAIVDLKAAIRYIRHNKGVMPGNPEWIFSTGVSAGGALSALLGASGNSSLYETYLDEIGAARERDNISGSACFCPIADLEHADGAYEWMYGPVNTRSGLVDQELSRQLKNSYNEYQKSLNLKGKDDFGTLTSENYDRYLLKYFLIPSANRYLKKLSEEKRSEYLSANKWLTWNGNEADFTFRDYTFHVGRMKGLPAFDDFDLKQPEPNLFGNKTIDSRHFTNFSLRHSTGDRNAEIDNEVKTLVNLMNPMYFIDRGNKDCAKYWWLRQGTSDNHTSQTVIANLAASLENNKNQVNVLLYWDAGHGADEDAEDFIAWIGKITGYSVK